MTSFENSQVSKPTITAKLKRTTSPHGGLRRPPCRRIVSRSCGCSSNGLKSISKETPNRPRSQSPGPSDSRAFCRAGPVIDVRRASCGLALESEHGGSRSLLSETRNTELARDKFLVRSFTHRETRLHPGRLLDWTKTHCRVCQQKFQTLARPRRDEEISF